MRQQTVRLNNTPATEVAQGDMYGSVTATSTMPFVNQGGGKKGIDLANALGMVSKTVTQAVELYKGQKDEEAINQFAKDKFTMLEEVNKLPSAADKQLWFNDKMQTLSKEGVNEKYRNAFVGAFSGMYNTVLGQVKEEGYKVQENSLFNDFSVGIEEGLSWEEMTSKYHNVLPKDRYHKVYSAAILQNATFEIQSGSIQTEEDFKAFKTKYSNILADYNKNPFTGGSKSIDAVDTKMKLTKSLDTLYNGFNAMFKENYQVEVAKIERDMSLTPDAYAKKLNGSQYQDKSEAIKKIAQYKKDFDEQQHLTTFGNNFDLHSSTNNYNWESLSDKEKKIVKNVVSKNLDYGLTNGAYGSVVETVVNNDKASESSIKAFFNTDTTDPTMLNSQITAYNGIKGTRDGDIVLHSLPKIDRATLEILSLNPNTDPKLIREVLNSDLKDVNQFGEKNKYKSDWDKATKHLSPTDLETADAIRVYALNVNGKDPKGAINYVKDNFIDSVTKKIDGKRVFGKVTEEQATKDLQGIKTVYEGFDYDTVKYDTNGDIIVSNSDNPFVESRITRDYLTNAVAGLNTQKQIDAAKGGNWYAFMEQFGKEVDNAVEAFKQEWTKGGGTRENFDNLINDITSFFSPTKAQGASLDNNKIYNSSTEVPSNLKLYGNKAADKLKEITNNPNLEERYLNIAKLEGFVNAKYKDDKKGDKGVVTFGFGQTGEYIRKSPLEVIKIHENKVKTAFPNYDKLDEKTKTELLQLGYRGDIFGKSGKPLNWVKLFNKGEYIKSAVELLNHKEYLNRKHTNGSDGVTKRLEAAATELVRLGLQKTTKQKTESLTEEQKLINLVNGLGGFGQEMMPEEFDAYMRAATK